MPIFDLLLDAGDDLVGERLVAILTDSEGIALEIFPVVEVARWSDRYSYAD